MPKIALHKIKNLAEFVHNSPFTKQDFTTPGDSLHMNYHTWEKTLPQKILPRQCEHLSNLWTCIPEACDSERGKNNEKQHLEISCGVFLETLWWMLFLWVLVSLIIWHSCVAMINMIIYDYMFSPTRVSTNTPTIFEENTFFVKTRVHSWPPFWAPHITLPRVLHHQPSCQLFVLPFLFEFRTIVLNGGWSSPNRGGTRIKPKHIPQITRRKGTYNHSRRYISWNSCVDHTKTLLIQAVEQPPTSRKGWRDLFSSSICRILWLATTSYQFQKTICEWQGIGLNLHVSDVVGSHFSLWTYVIVIPFYLCLEHPWASYAMMMKNLAQRPAQSSDSPRNLEMGVVGRSNTPGDQPWHIKKDMQLHSELDLKGWPWRGASHVGPLPAMPGRNERSCWYDVNSTFGCSKHLNDLFKHSLKLIINHGKDNQEVLPYQLLGSTWKDLVRSQKSRVDIRLR